MVWIEASDLVLRSASWMAFLCLVLLAWGLHPTLVPRLPCAPDPPCGL